MIVGLIGAKRSGKDTLAGRLVSSYGFERVAYADALKGAAYDMNPYLGADGLRLADLVDSIGWEAAKASLEVRRFLQALGVAMRDHVHRDIWTNVVRDRLEAAREYGTNIVVTDVRFPNEAEQIKEYGGIIVRIIRPTLTRDTADAHISERALDDYQPDYTVHNDSTLEALYAEADKVMAEEGIISAASPMLS